MNAVEIRSLNFGILELMDNFEPLGKSSPRTIYNFQFLTIFYCDLKQAPASRSMHQIDGQRFPLELYFVFLKSLRTNQDQEKLFSGADPEVVDNDDVNHSVNFYEANTVAIIVVVQGKVCV